MVWGSTIVPNVCFHNGLWFCMVLSVLDGLNFFSNCHGVTWPLRHNHKNKNFATTGKIILLWLTFNKEPRVNYDVTMKYIMWRLVEMACKNHKFKVIGLYSENYYCVSRIFYIKNVFPLSFSKGFSHRIIFLTLGFKKNNCIVINGDSWIF